MKKILFLILLTVISYTVFNIKTVEFPKLTDEQMLEYRLKQAGLWDTVDILYIYKNEGWERIK